MSHEVMSLGGELFSSGLCLLCLLDVSAGYHGAVLCSGCEVLSDFLPSPPVPDGLKGLPVALLFQFSRCVYLHLLVSYYVAGSLFPAG